MSGPDGSMTKRDARRNARRAQFEMQQADRRRERERKIRRQRLQTYAIIGGGILLFLLIGFLVIHAVIVSGGSSPSPHHGSYSAPVGGGIADRSLRQSTQEGIVLYPLGWDRYRFLSTVDSVRNNDGLSVQLRVA